ncbi:hypothetical protein DDE74_37055 [Streptomyces lydicus]|uniref:Aminoglycoside phosphotransferase domain-containing protein n=1 Tax=Streptomyces lydicus TaxID=47763 RepID=A0A3S9YL00_9ACTN|nr:phosphotransferase [Streptomyces lydicus]AZS75753.1 hypothetical protein DDE74_37055 [Streptomyces lydicus]
MSGPAAALAPSDREWIPDRSDELLEAYAHRDFPLGQGLVHGDTYPGNTLWDGSAARLNDWDEAATGPRKAGLANAFQGVRFGPTATQLRSFSDAYGYDLADWPGLSVLTELRDLHTLGSFIRRGLLRIAHRRVAGCFPEDILDGTLRCRRKVVRIKTESPASTRLVRSRGGRVRPRTPLPAGSKDASGAPRPHVPSQWIWFVAIAVTCGDQMA